MLQFLNAATAPSALVATSKRAIRKCKQISVNWSDCLVEWRPLCAADNLINDGDMRAFLIFPPTQIFENIDRCCRFSCPSSRSSSEFCYILFNKTIITYIFTALLALAGFFVEIANHKIDQHNCWISTRFVSRIMVQAAENHEWKWFWSKKFDWRARRLDANVNNNNNKWYTREREEESEESDSGEIDFIFLCVRFCLWLDVVLSLSKISRRSVSVEN